jgi:hypothetical protein
MRRGAMAVKFCRFMIVPGPIVRTRRTP